MKVTVPEMCFVRKILALQMFAVFSFGEVEYGWLKSSFQVNALKIHALNTTEYVVKSVWNESNLLYKRN